jgi:hypothetical protein
MQQPADILVRGNLVRDTASSTTATDNMKKVILFGASKAGEMLLPVYQAKGYTIIAFSDNNSAIHHTEKNGVVIIPPEQINSTDFDEIVVCSQYWREIYEQLTITLSIPKQKVTVASSSESKSISFEDPKVMAQAETALLYLLEVFNEAKKPYFLDGGTLLGLARSGQLIPWDNDIDISVLQPDADFYCQLISESVTGLEQMTGSKWTLYHLHHDSSDSTWKKGDLRKIVLHHNSCQFKVAIIIRYHEAPYYRYGAVSCVFSDHERHFKQQQWLRFLGSAASVPYDYPAFLTNTYGDWQKEVKDWRYTDYKNINLDLGSHHG